MQKSGIVRRHQFTKDQRDEMYRAMDANEAAYILDQQIAPALAMKPTKHLTDMEMRKYAHQYECTVKQVQEFCQRYRAKSKNDTPDQMERMNDNGRGEGKERANVQNPKDERLKRHRFTHEQIKEMRRAMDDNEKDLVKDQEIDPKWAELPVKRLTSMQIRKYAHMYGCTQLHVRQFCRNYRHKSKTKARTPRKVTKAETNSEIENEYVEGKDSDNVSDNEEMNDSPNDNEESGQEPAVSSNVLEAKDDQVVYEYNANWTPLGLSRPCPEVDVSQPLWWIKLSDELPPNPTSPEYNSISAMIDYRASFQEGLLIWRPLPYTISYVSKPMEE